MSTVLSARARLNALQRHRDAGDPAIVDARRELAAASIEEHVRRVLADAPPLTASQTARLRDLLTPAAERGG